MKDCLFCKMADGRISTDFIYEDEDLMVFKDINPQAPVHLLIVPKEHIESANDINGSNSHLVARIFEVISDLSEEMGLDQGYRVINNCKEHGGQSVDHIHFHLLAVRQMMWPPG